MNDMDFQEMARQQMMEVSGKTKDAGTWREPNSSETNGRLTAPHQTFFAGWLHQRQELSGNMALAFPSVIPA